MATSATKTRKRNVRKHNVKLVAIGAVAVLSMLGLMGLFNHPTNNTTPAAKAQAVVFVEEDDPAWNCRTMGNRICGPGNSNGVTPGIYTSQGNLILAWDAWLDNLNKIDHESKAKH